MSRINRSISDPILAILKQYPDTLLTPNYIAACLDDGSSRVVIMQRLHRMLERGEVQRPMRGFYQIAGAKAPSSHIPDFKTQGG